MINSEKCSDNGSTRTLLLSLDILKHDISVLVHQAIVPSRVRFVKRLGDLTLSSASPRVLGRLEDLKNPGNPLSRIFKFKLKFESI